VCHSFLSLPVPVSLSVSLSLSLSQSVSVSLSLSLSQSVSVSLSLSLSLSQSVSVSLSLSLSQSVSVSLSLSVGPPVPPVPQRGGQVLAALVLPPQLAVRQRRRDVAGGAGQRHVQEAGPRLQEAGHPGALMTSRGGGVRRRRERNERKLFPWM